MKGAQAYGEAFGSTSTLPSIRKAPYLRRLPLSRWMKPIEAEPVTRNIEKGDGVTIEYK